MPLWWRAERPEELTVRALHDGKELAILLSWADTSHDATAIRPQDFRDAAAVAFSLTPDPPFFAMGQPGGPVNIWMWKAERQADLEPAFQDLEKVYPEHRHRLLPEPAALAPRAAHAPRPDPRVRPHLRHRLGRGQHRGRSHAQERRRGPDGPGLRHAAGPAARRPGRGRARASTRPAPTACSSAARSGAASADAVSLAPGTRTPVSFAVWNGSAGDRDGKKSVTIWQELLRCRVDQGGRA